MIVVGCGRVGSGLAIALEDEGHSVAIIDKQSAAFRRLPDGWSGQNVVGFGFDQDDLERAGIRRADALAAVTSGDNSNILTARIARETYEIPAVVARIYDPRRAEIYQRLGIATVATVPWAISQAMRRIFPGRVAFEWSDPNEGVHLVEAAIPDTWGGRRLVDIEKDGRVRLVAVTRGGTSMLATPNLLAQEGDVLHVAVAAGDHEALGELLGAREPNRR